MNVETLDLDGFDIDTHEPPSFKDYFVSLDNSSERYEDKYDEDEDDTDEDKYDEDHDDEDDENENEINSDEIEIHLDDDYQTSDIDMEECDNIIYSFPFFSKNGIDFEYRMTIKDDELILDQVKCDDSEPDFENCVEVLEEIYRGELSPSIELIQQNIDLRDHKSILEEGIIDYDFDNYKDNTEKLQETINRNKISVLFELYKEITDAAN